METPVTNREMNLRVFKGKYIPHVFFQPRFEPWYWWQKKFQDLGPSYRDMSLLELYDHLRVSIRYTNHLTGIPYPILTQHTPDVKVHEESTDKQRILITETPFGDLTEKQVLTVDDEWREVEFPVKQPDDLKKLRWICQRTTYTFSEELFDKGSQFIGDRGEPQFWLPKSPYQGLAQVWMKYFNFIYALVDYPDEMQETMMVVDEMYNRLYEEIVNSGKVKIVNFGENIHDHISSPPYFERYLIPWFEKRSNQLRKAGIFTHIHLDGYFHSLLKFLRILPFDGYEALTPFPQGDVTIEEIKEYIGDKILVDGIPAVLFLPTYSDEQLMETVQKIVQLFHPRLVLGVSDEVPQGAEAQGAITKLKMVSDWCRKYQV